MAVNIVVKLGWILERLAHELQSIPGVTINCGGEERKALAGGVNYYIPAKDVRKFPADGPALGLFTHGESGFDVVDRFQVAVTMNLGMAGRLAELKPRRIVTIRPGAWEQQRQPVFGVIGRVYNDGRKGTELVEQAVAAGFRFLACGSTRRTTGAMSAKQWPCETMKGSVYDAETRERFYSAIDYLVVTSRDEGGPMAVPEAIARHVPVIAPDVGWCWEFPVIHYERGSWESLRSVLLGLTETPTWQGWTFEHRKLFAEVQA